MSEPASAAPHGAQPERTAMSWQRTALATMTGSMIITRHSAPILGAPVLFVLVISIGLTAAAFILGRRRYALPAAEPSRRRDGRAPAALAAAMCVMALTEILATVMKGA